MKDYSSCRILVTTTFDWLVNLILNVLVNNFLVMLRRSHCFLGITSTCKCALLKDTTLFDPSGTRTQTSGSIVRAPTSFDHILKVENS